MKIKVATEMSFSIGRGTFLPITISTNVIVVTLLLVALIQVSVCVLRLDVAQSAFLRAFAPAAGV